MITPAQQFARLSLTNGERLYALQLEIAQNYIDIGVEQLKALTEVKDPESLQAFIAKQVDVTRNVGEKLIADTQAIVELGQEFNAETQKLAQDSLNVVVSLAA
jgi:phasin family protein